MKIVQLDPKASAKAEVVKMAKTILAQAENGEIVDLAYCAAQLDGGLVTGFTVTEDAPRRLAAVTRLVHRLNVSWDEQGYIEE